MWRRRAGVPVLELGGGGTGPSLLSMRSVSMGLLLCRLQAYDSRLKLLRSVSPYRTSALSPDGASVESAGPEASPDSPSIYDVADPPLSPFTGGLVLQAACPSMPDSKSQNLTLSMSAGNETAAPPNLALAPTIEEAYVESLEFGAPNVEYWNTEIGQFVNATSVGFANTTNSSSVEASTTLIGMTALLSKAYMQHLHATLLFLLRSVTSACS